MAYTAPPTFVAADPLAAAELNVLGDDIAYLYGQGQGFTFSGVRVARLTNQAIADTTATEITFTSESWDFGGWWSTGTDVVVPAAAIPPGYTTIMVLLIARARFASDAAGYRRLSLLVDGTAYNRTSVDANSGAETEVNVTDFVECAAGAVISLEAYHNAGHALNAEISTFVAVRFAPAA
jgi:hypothetical protein